MKTTDYAIDYLYSLLKGKTGIPSALYKHEKPSITAGTEYIVINSLPVNAGVLQTCHANVNYHVQDLAPGITDFAKLKTGTATIMGLVEQVDSTTSGIYIDFESQQFFSEPTLSETYSNIRLKIKILNT
ncbi:MAG: hypothetical protein M0Q91_11970 [Methanoregula sp.]|jgi:hypothetical protein|nr:hypothetical protein [Methanoregula sp.]